MEENRREESTDVKQQLRNIQHVLEQIKSSQEELLVAAQQERICSVQEDTATEIGEIQDHIQSLDRVLDKRDTEIQQLKDRASDASCRLDHIIQLVKTRKHFPNVESKGVHSTQTAESIRNQQKKSVTASATHKKLEIKSTQTYTIGKTDSSVHLSGQNVQGTQRSKENVSNSRLNKNRTGVLEESEDLAVEQNITWKRTIPDKTTGKVLSRSGKVTTHSFGFKSLVTKEQEDNRVKYFTEERSSSESAATKHEQFLQYLRSEKQNVTANLQDLKRKKEKLVMRPEQSRKMSSNDYQESSGTDYHSFLEDNGSESLAEIGFREWTRYAEDERQKGALNALPRGQGPDTVLCLDTSGSMIGEPFHEMISIALKIVEGIKEVSRMYPIPENVAVTTYGAESRVVIHLTDRYDDVITAIRGIKKPKGPSPMAGGLLIALAGCLGNGRPVCIGDTLVGTRIILISDGHATPDHLRLDHDNVKLDMAMKLRVDNNLFIVAEKLKERREKVFCIPVGNANLGTLQKVSEITNGKLYPATSQELSRVVNYSQHLMVAIDIVKNVAVEEGTDPRPLFEAHYHTIGFVSVTPDVMKENVIDIAISLYKSADYLPEGMQMVERHANLPPLGTRVCRGPAWHFGGQDGDGPGTVYNHGRSGVLWVEWDNGHRNLYHYTGGHKEVVKTDQQRVLVHDLIATGCKVKKGPDWFQRKHNHEAYNGIGVVIRVQEDGVVHVRWPNKKVLQHRFGYDGKFELALCEENDLKISDTAIPRMDTNSEEGLRIESFLPPPTY